MPEEIPTSAPAESLALETGPEPGPVGAWLTSQGFDHGPLGKDHLGIEMIGVEGAFLPLIATALKTQGFDYLQCQGGYDEGPGGLLVSFYNLVKLAELADLSPAGEVPADHPPRKFGSRCSWPGMAISPSPPSMASFGGLTGRSGKPLTCSGSITQVTPTPSDC